MSAADDILDGALKLAHAERARIARELLASLESDADVDSEEAWAKELEARVREVRNGAAELEDWETARKQIAANLRK